MEMGTLCTILLIKIMERMIKLSEKKKRNRDRERSHLTSMQEVTYGHEFKMADRAGGYLKNKR
jgi:hypothetical protein